MKLIKAVVFSFFALIISFSASAQTKSEKIDVSGNCGMCKKTIEKAALDGGAKSAVWETTSKVLTVKYDAKRTDVKKIQQSVANTGYDTKDIKGNDGAYEKLHSCCKYDRTKTYASAKK